MNKPFTLNRRGFLQTIGSLTLAFTVPLDIGIAAETTGKLAGDLKETPLLSAWLRINAEGTVTLMIGKVELGQGILTAVTQICADELDVNLERVKLISGDTAVVPNEGTTAGSQSMPGCAPAVQQASAEVRRILIEMAAGKLGQPIESLKVSDGIVTGPGGAKATYWELVTGKELERQATGNVPLKPVSEHRYIGKSVTRVDIPAKMTGEAIFLQEYRPEGMVHGRIVRPPTYSAKLTQVDTGPIEKMPGVLKIVRNGSFLGIIAEREEQAIAAAAELTNAAKWEVQNVLPGHEGIYDWLLAAKTADKEIHKKERPAGGEPAKVVEATYRRPYHMHASIGTSAAIGTLGGDGTLTIQTHSQSVFETAEAIAKMLGMEVGKVRCQHMQGSGCYGHNMADDAAADAALLATALPGRPVRLVYSREQEHKWEPYGSAMVVKTRAAVDAQGNILDWNLDLWSTPHGTRPGGEPGNLLSARYLEKPFQQPVPRNGGPPNYAADRNAIALYDFPGQRVVTHFITEMPLRVSSTRGLGAYANVFAIESFIDELAKGAGADPLEYRLRFLKDQRARDVLVKAAESFGWDKFEKKAGRGRGIAFARYKNYAGFCAVAMEVEVNRRNGRVRVVRVATAADSGHVVSPDGIANQIEGGVIQSLSWSLKEEVKFDNSKVLSEDWASYPILTFSEVPPVEVTVINRPGEAYLGTGEASQGPTSAALANAIFDATDVRFRQLPFTPDRIKAGLT
ncbi:xanthine dehydrogenase family protein molybdopterin-binding subunit [Microvirga alba]|uniref:Xanthine dehydrogenase family protein molybdopterin-binding subunit n=1 Tax=Microvirga alba TaxID=2791025 RepID=A0A931BV26_9HYPH|nr:molybdopterin cofactor-binding domain-containing protein [Microvirga alba]MBF9235263.1 xanthine dehydrogenase family protein molybdopterin-binding subunit [Microvirga alba]